MLVCTPECVWLPRRGGRGGYLWGNKMHFVNVEPAENKSSRRGRPPEHNNNNMSLRVLWFFFSRTYSPPKHNLKFHIFPRLRAWPRVVVSAAWRFGRSVVVLSEIPPGPAGHLTNPVLLLLLLCSGRKKNKYIPRNIIICLDRRDYIIIIVYK